MRGSFNLYWYSKEAYKACKDMINETNHKHLEVINAWLFLICLMYTFFSIFNIFGATKHNAFAYAIFSVVTAAYQFWITFGKKWTLPHTTFVAYLHTVVMLAIGIYQSESNMFTPATLYPLLLTIVALSYISSVFKMTIGVVTFSTIFLLTDFYNKPFSIAMQDLYAVVIVFILGEILHFMFSRTRMKQFEAFRQNTLITQELEVSSSFDSLTQLLNRGRFFNMSNDVIRSKERHEYIVVALLDLDGFKQINDKYGHQMGDKVLQNVGQIILNGLRADMSEKWKYVKKTMDDKDSFAGRLGGDEFIVFLRGLETRQQAESILETLLKLLNEREVGEIRGINASIGVTEIVAEDYDMDKVYSRADELLYKAKEAGKNRIIFE